MRLIFSFLLGTVVIVSLVYSIIRDTHLIKLFPVDLRNRVVGARLQKDQQSPYFYKWQHTDGIRYYDPKNFDSTIVSPSTASPFFHILLYPIIEFQQLTINRIWLVIQYIVLVIVIGISVKLSVTATQKTLAILLGVGFTFTDGWVYLIVVGQLYLFLSLLGMLFILFVKKQQSYAYALTAGIVFITAILIRPNFALFFLPFILLYKNYKPKYISVFLLPAIIMLTWIGTSTTQRNLWKEYRGNIDEQIKIHYTGNPSKQINESDPNYQKWEGLDQLEIQKELNKGWFVNDMQHSSIFALWQNIFHTKLPLRVLITTFFIVALLMCFVYYLFTNKKNRCIYSVAIFGFCLYMLCDFFSPITRYPYYSVQWLFPLLLSVIFFSNKYWKIYLLTTGALVLNIIDSPVIKMEHTLGEYIWLASFFYLSLVYEDNKILIAEKK